MVAHPVDQVVVAHAQAEQEAAGEGLLQAALGVGHGDGIAGVDVGDARGDRDPARRGQQDGGVDERLLVHRRLAEPERRIAELLDLGGGIALGGGGLQSEQRQPHTDPPEPAAEPIVVGRVDGHGSLNPGPAAAVHQ